MLLDVPSSRGVCFLDLNRFSSVSVESCSIQLWLKLVPSWDKGWLIGLLLLFVLGMEEDEDEEDVDADMDMLRLKADVNVNVDVNVDDDDNRAVVAAAAVVNLDKEK